MKYFSAIILFFLMSTNVNYAQTNDTVFYQYSRTRVATFKLCDYYSFIETDEATGLIKEVQFNKKHEKTEEQFYIIADNKKIKEGVWTTWHSNGQIESETPYKNNKITGLLKTYWPDGTPKRADSLFADNFVSGECYNEKGKKIKHFPYHIEPEFQGGVEALYRYLKRKIYYPQTYDVTRGEVIVRFLVRKDGSIDNVEVLNVTKEFMAKQVTEAIWKMPRWKPGKVDGEPRDEFVLLPVTFMR